jgi:MSHA biogenesis protein MshM
MASDEPLDQAALKRLGFTRFPFQDSAAAGSSLYLSRQHRYVVQRAIDLVTWEQGFGMIEGPVGVGKSSIARHLYAHYKEAKNGVDYQVVYLPTADYTSLSIAAQGLASALGVSTHRKAPTQMGVLYDYFFKMREQQKVVIVLWDDCHRMRPAALGLFQSIWNFDVASKLVQNLLFATPAIHRSLVGYPDLIDRFAQWDRLSPLDPTEALALIVHRCQIAGRDEPLLNDSAFNALYEVSKGMPRPMVLICYEVLRLLAQRERKIATADDMMDAINLYRQRAPGQA